MMEKAAAKSDEGELYVRLGNVYLDGDQFSKAADAVQKGLDKGGVKRPDQARLVPSKGSEGVSESLRFSCPIRGWCRP